MGVAVSSCVVGSDAFREGPEEGAALVTRARVEMPGCHLRGAVLAPAQVYAALHLPACILLLCVPGWRSFLPGFDVLIPQSCLLRLRSAAAPQAPLPTSPTPLASILGWARGPAVA